MKKHYSILWIDDEPDSIRTSIKDLTNHLRKVGVIAQITYSNPLDWTNGFTTVPEIMDCLKNPELDMVLMDYNLGDKHGSDIIAELRQTDIYVPIIYYSQQHYDDLKTSLLEDDVDGVFISPRPELETKAKKILDSLLKREHRVRRMRGLLLTDSSELEGQGASIAERCWNLLSEEQKVKVRTDYKKYLNKSFRKHKCILDTIDFEFVEISTFWSQRILDANKRGYLLKIIVKELGWTDHAVNISILCGGEQPIQIFSERNKFAHQTESELQALIDALPDIDFPKELREELHKAEQNLQNLLSDIEKAENK
jgi:CheY-like chemotaxis protein